MTNASRLNGPLARLTFRLIIVLVAVTVLSILGALALLGQRNAVLGRQAADAEQILENQVSLLAIQQQILSETKRATLENQRLLRFTVCVLKISAPQRTATDVDRCVKENTP